MGLIDRAKEAVGMGEEEDDGFDEEFDDDPVEEEEEFGEFSDDDLDEFGEVEDDGPDIGPWDTAYKCHDELIQHEGFTGTQEFLKRYMAWRVKQSPEFRDRFEVGAETANLISGAIDDVQSIGSDDSQTDFGKAADKLDEANRFVEKVEDFDNKEEQMVQGILGTVNKAIDTLDGNFGTGESNISGGVRKSDEEI